MSLLYDFDLETVADILKILAKDVNRRRLEKGLSREALSAMSGVAVSTISKFEQKHTISLASFIALAKALGYKDKVKELLSAPLYNTIEELDTINKNKTRKRGRYKFDKLNK